MTLTPAQIANRIFATLRQMGASEAVAHLHAYHRVNANPYEGEHVTYRRNAECPFCPDLLHPIGERVFTDEPAFATVVSEPDSSTGWFDVEYDDGRRALANDDRVITAAAAERLTGLRDVSCRHGSRAPSILPGLSDRLAARAGPARSES